MGELKGFAKGIYYAAFTTNLIETVWLRVLIGMFGLNSIAETCVEPWFLWDVRLAVFACYGLEGLPVLNSQSFHGHRTR